MAEKQRSPSIRAGNARRRKAILEAREIIAAIAARNANEAETRHHVVRIFDQVLGYDPYRHLSMEHAVRGVGNTDHVDLAITVDDGPRAKPVMLVELKRVGCRLKHRHIKQADAYAVRLGCEWVVLTDGREWMLYHIDFGQPPQSKLVEHWNLLEDEPEVLVRQFHLISFENVRSDGLGDYWRKRRVLSSRNLLGAIFSKPVLNELQGGLRSRTSVLLPVEDIMGGLRRLLNESALATMEDVTITFPPERSKGTRKAKRGSAPPVTLKALIEARALKVPLELFSDYKGTRLTAKPLANGTIEFHGEVYDSPSQAGSAARATVIGRLASTNGWTFWCFHDRDGHVRTLEFARSLFAAGEGLTRTKAAAR